MAKKGTKKMPGAGTREEQLTKPVRLDLKPSDHVRLDQMADHLGLTMAAYVRMAVLQRLLEDEIRRGDDLRRKREGVR